MFRLLFFLVVGIGGESRLSFDRELASLLDGEMRNERTGGSSRSRLPGGRYVEAPAAALGPPLA